MNPNDTPNSRNDMPNKRINARLSFQEECFLSNGFGTIKCKTFDVSKEGMGVLINETIPFETGDKMSAFIKIVGYKSQAQAQWIKNDVGKDESRVGLKLSTGLLY